MGYGKTWGDLILVGETLAYVEWHDTVRNHYKTDALMLALGVKRREAVGIIGCLSSWAIQYRPGGIIEKRLVKVAVEWEGDDTPLLSALLEIGWLDKIDDEKYAIHDWEEITRGFRKGRADAARRKRDISATDASKTRLSSAVAAPNRTERTERTEQNEQSRGEKRAAAPASVPASGGSKTGATPKAEAARQLAAIAIDTQASPNTPETLGRVIKAMVERHGGQRVQEWLMDPTNKGKNTNELQDELNGPRAKPGESFKPAATKCSNCGGTGKVAGGVKDGAIVQVPCNRCQKLRAVQ